jgi:putative GTP pyrophosphokinase
MAAVAPSKKEIDRAGTKLRDWLREAAVAGSGSTHSDEEISDAYNCLASFREGFGTPLTKTTMGVRSMVRTVRAPLVVSQRLKRIVTMLDKLDRHENMKVTRMQDIAGCRAILPSEAHTRGVVKRMEAKSWEIRNINDYIAKPKDTGYRAVHVVVTRDEHLVEIQLRTTHQHRWASTVERFSGYPGFGRLKDGYGPTEAVEFFRKWADVMGVLETGVTPDKRDVRKLDELRVALLHLIDEG